MMMVEKVASHASRLRTLKGSTTVELIHRITGHWFKPRAFQLNGRKQMTGMEWGRRNEKSDCTGLCKSW